MAQGLGVRGLGFRGLGSLGFRVWGCWVGDLWASLGVWEIPSYIILFFLAFCRL